MAGETPTAIGRISAWLHNPAQRVLALGGFGLVVVGALLAAWANMAAQDERNGNDLLVSLGGFEYFDPDAGSGFQGWMAFGIAVLVTGVVMLVALLAVKAAEKPQAQA